MYRSSVFSLTITKSTSSLSAGVFGYDFAGRIFAYKSNFCLNATMTSLALSPTGAFKHASDDLIDSKTSSGNAFPVFSSAASPATSELTLNLMSNLSLIVSKIVFTDSDNSGPIPSPVIREILYIHNHLKFCND
ncbi:MAG: Uncharacterised protein [Candidatus Nitrosopelagicus brevis]|nr:MAG: Uncharacterised protein [Candidatus Nitrosopelagicus brevis]